MSSRCQRNLMCLAHLCSICATAPSSREEHCMKITRIPPAAGLVTPLSWVVLIAFGAALVFGWQAFPARPAGTALADGIAALHASDYATARRAFQTPAGKNDPAGENWPPPLYPEGPGIAPDPAPAGTRLAQAAEAGPPQP